MAWLAVDFDGMEYIFASKPIRNKAYNCWQLDDSRLLLDVVDLPKGSIKKLIGRDLTFDDEPVELKDE
uniref:Uncharacterized protein n=1 Tax=Siphoviridae sp. ctKHH22 TaxID=2825439 RepID=A0A8S5Q260_9CAUD|nr:MAG TPA: hypothetical protein [Siphoviridae sp. ctKHH22]